MVDYQNLEDGELIHRTAAGDQDALAAIYTRYATPVYSLARYMLRHEAIAEEATQEVFLNLWLKSATYNAARGAPKAWIMSVAHHKIIDIIRSRRRAAAIADPKEYETLDLLPSGQVPTDEAAERTIEAERVRRAVTTLPPAQQEIITLAYYNGLSQSEIAARLDQPLGTVKTRARLAMQKLRVELAQDDAE